jgi:hypothetical protein
MKATAQQLEITAIQRTRTPFEHQRRSLAADIGLGCYG